MFHKQTLFTRLHTFGHILYINSPYFIVFKFCSTTYRFLFLIFLFSPSLSFLIGRSHILEAAGMPSFCQFFYIIRFLQLAKVFCEEVTSYYNKKEMFAQLGHFIRLFEMRIRYLLTRVTNFTETKLISCMLPKHF